jgi:hypothetical protein
MTRAEQLAQAAARAQEKLDRDKKSLAQVQAQQRSEERKARNKRRVEVGTLADAAGLCALDDTTLTELFALLASLAEGPSPGAVLESLVMDETWKYLEGTGHDTHARKEAPWNSPQNSSMPQAGS